MKTRRQTIKNVEYLLFELEAINQGENKIFQAKISAEDLLEMYTVRPAKYDIEKNSSLAESFPDEVKYYEHLVESNRESLGTDFQRDYDESRVKKIASFLDNDRYPFFPNAIIVTCDIIDGDSFQDLDGATSVSESLKETTPHEHLATLISIDSTPHLLVPRKPNTLLIIDGQHRIEGLRASNSIDLTSYEIPLSFIIGYDRSVIAKQFYTINYEQKSVNKSLLYHLTGEFSTSISEISFLHNVVKILNEVKSSPFHKRVKMLGRIPKDTPSDEKQLLSISQAAFIDSLIKTISPHSINSIYQPVFLYYYYKKELRAEVINTLISFFNAVRELKPDWETPEESLLSKGMGVGALMRVFQFLFVKMLVDDFDYNIDSLTKLKSNDYKKRLLGLETVSFSSEGEFGKVGSSGNLNKIKESVIESLEYFRVDSYEEFVQDYKTNYLTPYANWLMRQRS